MTTMITSGELQVIGSCRTTVYLPQLTTIRSVQSFNVIHLTSSVLASDSANGYIAWGGPPLQGEIDGTIVPCAAAGSIPFLPNETLAVLHNLRTNYTQQAWSRYGFIDAFNPLTNWTNPDVIGIDVGITMLMAENYRTEFVWKYFMQNPHIQNAMAKIGFIPYKGNY